MLAVALASSSRTGHARGVDDELKTCFERGSMHYRLGEFADAAVEYKRCYKIKADPSFLYNIAQAYRMASDFQNALFFYRSYLNSTGGNAKNRVEVEDRIHKLENEVAIQKAPPNSTVDPGSTLVAPAKPEVETIQAVLVAPAPVKKTPVYKKWWLWTTVGVVVAAGVGVGLGIGLTQNSAPGTHFGTSPVF